MRERIVIKCGGSMLAHLGETFFQCMKQMVEMYDVIIVHGGGPEIDAMLNKLSIPIEKKDGLRVTTAEVMEIVQMVLCGSTNKTLVSKLNEQELGAIGLSGCDGMLLKVAPLEEEFGFVGEVQYVQTMLLEHLLANRFVPVVAPVGVMDGQVYNVNADTAAAAIATAMNAKNLIFITDVDGVIYKEELLEQAEEKQLLELIDNGIITGGMIPKVKAALMSLELGVKDVVIVNGTQRFLTNKGEWVGTTIKKGGIYNGTACFSNIQ
ncbi:acetylglutamate kinase [Bacillus sp. S14(2024)]|uniref:acetylglutamate kinase n=1 Tax=Bacillus sp. S14(2024) TaxID=3162884 RepID=UPI003D1C099E